MRKLMKEILVILVLMALMINSSLLMIVSTALDAISEALDESKINSVLEMSLEKYVNYSLDEQTKGTLVQMNVKTGIEYAEGQEYNPLEYTETLLQAPKIEGEYPERVEFIAKSTKATNGDDNAKDIGYEYDRNNGIVRVGVQNKEDEQGNVYSENVNGARDEFAVLYYYGANCYNDQNIKRELEFKGKISEAIHNDDKSKIEKDYSNSQEVTENIGGLVSTNVSTSDLYNGYIYSNINNGTDLDTEYTENTQLSISYKEISDEIVINQNTKFIDAKDDEVDTQDVVYKGAKINKDKIVNVLGEDFKIYVLNDAGETIAEINKDTETDDSGIIDLNYDKEYTNVNFKVSKPVKAGYLQIENKKAIKNTMKTIENNKIKLTQEIICQNNIQEKNEQTGEVKNEYTKQVNSYKTESIAEIKNSESKIELHSDKQKLTNSTKNDVIFTAVLKTNEAKYNLFKNPVIEIEMPSEVDNVILGDVSLLYDSNLSIKNYEVQDKNGIKVIRIQLDGTQTDYNNSVISEGANIIIPATIIVNKDIYSTQSSIKMKYSNETGIATSYAKQGKDCEELQINIDSMNVPVATYSAEGDDSNTMDVADSVTNVSLNGLKIESYAKVGDMTLKDGDTVYEKEVINYFVKLTNTTENEMTNFNVKALVPDGTTYITKDGSWAYQSTADTESIRNDLQIKYEDKKDVSTDLEKIEAGGTYALTYAVVVNDINDGEQKNLENKIFINDAETDSKVNLVAKKGKMKVDLYPADKEYGKYKNMYVFEARVYNTSNEKITNVKLESTLATEMELNYVTGGKDEYDATTKKLKIDVGDIDANSSKLVSIRLNAINFKDGISEYTIPFDLEVYGDNTDTYRGDTQHVKAYSADIVVKTESPTEGQEVEIGDEVEYNVTIKNTGTVNEYITGIDNLPDGIIPIKAKYNKFGYDSEGKEIIQKEEEISLTSKVEIEGEQSYDFKLESIIPKDETINITIIGEADAVDQKTEVSNNVTVYAKETGTKVSNGIVHTILPYEFEEEGEGEKPDISDEELYGKPPEGETDSTGDDEQTKDDNNNSNNGNGSNNGNNSNGGNNSSDSGDSSDTNSTNNKFYSISGKAWIDNNQDGGRNSDEELLKDVTVKLFNSDTNSIVTDKDGNSKITTTNDSGEYKFENIAKGNYLVIFGYDTNIYTTTKYQSSGATASTNSDAIAKEVSIDGQNKIVGVTDILNIKSDNIENIDIGLIKSQKFDLKLDKYVSKITVENSDGTKEYSYKNSKLAKVEIASKKLAGSTVKIEYKIVVTNEGELSGEVNEIIDYLPSGMTFDSELNKGWYKGYDGNLRNSSLAENKINPGETKELTLILSRTLTENSTGMIENIAEISSATNVNYVSDIDSTPGNKKEGEDDYSKAQVIVSIKTGIVQSITMIFIVLAVLIAVAFIMKNRKIRKSIKFFTMFIVFIFIGGYAFIAQADYYSTAITDDEYLEGLKREVKIRYKWNKENSHDNGLWIEKIDTNDDGENDTWVYGPAFRNGNFTMNNNGQSLSPGFICITPGYHLCSYEDHIYDLNTAVSSYLDYDAFKGDMSDYYYGSFGWESLSGINREFFQKTIEGNDGVKLTKNNKSSELEVKSADNSTSVVVGPFKYSLDKDVKDTDFHLWLEDNLSYDICDSDGNVIDVKDSNGKIIWKNEEKGFNMINAGSHQFYIKPLENGKYKSEGKIKLVIYVDGENTIIEKGIKVGVYEPRSSCMLGTPQTFIRLIGFTDTYEDIYSDRIEWNKSLNQGSLTIQKKGTNNENVPRIKFRIRRYTDDNGVKIYYEKYDRWTDEEGKIELKNISIVGKYEVTEIDSDNKKYPINIQKESDKKQDGIRFYYENKKEISFSNNESYFVQIKKVNSKNKEVEGVKFLVAEQGANEALVNAETNENGILEESLNFQINQRNDGLFKIIEMENNNNDLYLYPEKDYRPYLWIKYDGKSKEWYISDSNGTKYDLIRDKETINSIDKRDYDYTYKRGVKIGFCRTGNKIMLYYINDYIASIGIRKIDSDTNKRINGAKFKIYFKGTDGKNYYISSYSYDTSTRLAKVKWTTNEGDAKEFITGDKYADVQYDGVIKLKGIPKKTYYAKEVSAPEGYNYSSEKEYKIGKYESKKVKWTEKVDNEDKTYERTEYSAWFGTIKEINDVQKYVITNEPVRTIGIQKVDQENNGIKLNGVKFVIWRRNDNKTEYLSKYQYSKGSKNISWSTNENEAINFITGKNYLDGKVVYTRNGKTYYKNSNNEEKELIEKNDDTDNKGLIILKGMESKTYYAKEKGTIDYYELSSKTYKTNGKCQGTDVNWLINQNSDSTSTEPIYAINFNKNGGTGGTDIIYLKDKKLYYDSDCEQEISEIEVPEKDGYEFTGYLFEVHSSNGYSFDSKGKLVKNGELYQKITNDGYEGDLTLYAIWKKETEEIEDTDNKIYTITFNKKGGAGGTDKIYLKNKKLYTDNKCTNELKNIDIPTKKDYQFSGYKFDGQYVFNEDGSVNNGTVYNDIINGNYDDMSSIKLNAIWDRYNISFDKNGGKDGTSMIYINKNKFYSDSSCKIEIAKIEVPNKDGYSFKGYKFEIHDSSYAIDSDGKITDYLKEMMGYGSYSEDVTLYAIWEKQIITNKQKYVDISGYVWNDGNSGKTTVRNNIYDTNETLLKGVIVRLVDVNNKNKIIAQKTTDNKGRYKFEKVLIDELSNYRVEFSYNGLIYQCVEKEKEYTGTNTSKAEEQQADREQLNKGYAIVEKDRARSGDSLTIHPLTYTTNSHTSTLNWKIDDSDCLITSKTDIYENNIYTSYLEKRYKDSKINKGEEIYEIDNVNLGLYEREQPDMAIAKDIDNVEISLNDKTHIYKYGDRDKMKEEGQDIFSIAVKYKDDKAYTNKTYTRPIYESDYRWNPQNEKELTAYITYKITIKNESTSLKTKINSIVDYYSKTYELQGIGIKNGEEINYNNAINSSKKEDSTYISYTYKKVVIPTSYIGNIDSGIEKEIYIRFKLSRDDIISILGDSEHEATNELLNNTAEINSYSVYDKDGNIYAGIDKDSQPGNAEPGNIDTYEDDTESAPGFKIEVQSNRTRTISGTVFLDSTSDNTETNKTRNGDGKYGNIEGENTPEYGIKDVTVSLVDIDGKIVQIYNKEEKKWEDATATTDYGGNFSISGFLPGEYKLQYKWGGQQVNDKIITVQNYKGTIYDKARYTNYTDTENYYWYMDKVDERNNDAMDDYDTRNKIDTEMKDVTYDSYSNFENNEMISSTLQFEVNIEYSKDISSDNFSENGNYEYKIKNIDFGIAERARQCIELNKNVSNFKLNLPNENTELFNVTIKDGKLNGAANYIKYIKDDKIVTEIDTEIMQGSTAEVTYAFTCYNASETDYQDKDYYIFGEIPSNDDASEKLIKITPKTIVDYLDNKWGYKDNTKWKYEKNNEVYDENKNKLKYNNDSKAGEDVNVYYSNINESIEPGKSNETDISLTVTKLLSSNNDGVTLDNDAEIVQVSKNGGSQIKYMPGNYKHTDGSNSEKDDDRSEKIIIMPNTGKNLDFVTPISISILMLSILTTGIFLIKKKVLDSKN